MSQLHPSLLTYLLLPIAACGGRVVEFPLRGNPGDDTASDQPPTVLSTTPATDATEVALDRSFSATFSEPMNPDTLNTDTFTVTDGADRLAGYVYYDAPTVTATFIPDETLSLNTLYTAEITDAAEDSGGLAMDHGHAWSFTTTAVDAPPFVRFVSPTDGAEGVLIGIAPTATFSKAMAPSTLNPSTFTLSQGGNPVPGDVTYDATTRTATFTPDFDLDHHLPYTGTITTGAQDLGGLSIPNNYLWTFTTEVNTIPPQVLFSSPLNGSIDVPIGAEPTATFSADMSPATLNEVTFTLHQGVTQILGVVNYDAASLTATFTPDLELDFDLVYFGTITTGATDTDGLPLVANYLWSFTTQLNNIPPEVISETPLNGAIDVLVDAAPTATFSVDMDPLSIDELSFTLDEGVNVVTGTVAYDVVTRTATFTPDLELDSNALYTATINTLAEDPGGLALVADHVWTFTTETVIYPPEVVSTTPLDTALDVSINTRPTATFTVDMDPATVTAATFTVMDGTTPVSGTVTYDAGSYTATFTPDQVLDLSTLYTVTLSAGIEDLAGTPMGTDFVWEITTAACSVADLDLGSASVFAILAGSTVTNANLTTITGDLGLSPGTSVTGFPPGILVGTLHAGDATAATAQADLTLAYVEATSRTACAVTVAGNLGGSTLPPGLYKSTSSLEISAGDLTLDALGDSDAVFLFQTASAFTATTARAVVLANGAKAANVYWKVGTSATLAASSVMKGTILANQGISIASGATLDGRALARAAAVTLDANTVVSPTP